MINPFLLQFGLPTMPRKLTAKFTPTPREDFRNMRIAEANKESQMSDAELEIINEYLDALDDIAI